MKPIAQAVPGAVTRLLRDAPLSPGKVGFAWRLTVGPAMDRATAPRLVDGALVVDVPDPNWARELRRSSRVVLARLQALLGADAVTRLEVRARRG